MRAILDLTMQESAFPVKISAIAKRQEIPQKFLELILAGLKQGGFVASRRGAGGGYRLTRPPDQITVGEVLRFVEGTKVNRSLPGKEGDNPFTDMWQSVDAAVSAILDHTTFAAAARDWRQKLATYIPNWQI